MKHAESLTLQGSIHAGTRLATLSRAAMTASVPAA